MLSAFMFSVAAKQLFDVTAVTRSQPHIHFIVDLTGSGLILFSMKCYTV